MISLGYQMTDLVFALNVSSNWAAIENHTTRVFCIIVVLQKLLAPSRKGKIMRIFNVAFKYCCEQRTPTILNLNQLFTKLDLLRPWKQFVNDSISAEVYRKHRRKTLFQVCGLPYRAHVAAWSFERISYARMQVSRNERQILTIFESRWRRGNDNLNPRWIGVERNFGISWQQNAAAAVGRSLRYHQTVSNN